MMKVLLPIGMLLIIINCSWAQVPEEWNAGPNLVPNPSFEKLRRGLPGNDLDGSIAFRNSIASWMSPTKSTPDLTLFLNTGNDWDDNPRTGKAMVGILTHNPESKRSDTYREYIQVKLEKPLEEGKEYYVEFWARRSKSSKMTSNNLGVALSPAPTINQDWNPLTSMHTVVNETKIINPDKPEWVKISSKFTAANRENFLVIGNFFDNENTTFGEGANPEYAEMFEMAYYLIDDVGLWELNVLPEPEPEPEVFVEKTIEVGQVIRLDRICFEFDKWNLLSASFEELDELLALLNKYPSMKIAIHGHTDSRGSASYNFTLSNNRAESVYNYLGNNGIAQDRIQFEGFGEERPIAGHTTDAEHQMNRRVEFVVLELGVENVSVENVTDH